MYKYIELYPLTLEEEAWGVNIEKRLNEINGKIVSVTKSGEGCYNVVYLADNNPTQLIDGVHSIWENQSH